MKFCSSAINTFLVFVKYFLCCNIIKYTSLFCLQLDVVAFANIAQLHFIDKEVTHPLRDAMNESFPNLVGLVSRIKERAFHDWDDICATLDLNAHLPKPPKETKESKEGTGPAEKQPEEAEKGKVGINNKKVFALYWHYGHTLKFCNFQGDEKEKELEKEPEEKKEKENEKEK